MSASAIDTPRALSHICHALKFEIETAGRPLPVERRLIGQHEFEAITRDNVITVTHAVITVTHADNGQITVTHA